MPFLRLFRLVLLTLSFLGASLAAAVDATPSGERFESLKQMSLEDLMLLEVSTVSRKSEQWWSAPGAVDVVTGEDIRRAGAFSLPDALRLASGVHVTQPKARTWGIGMRGFTLPGGNKVNVQIDGRTLFTPFYSGVFWDAQDTMLADIDRIEVVRGPVGALWGAYAVNGFVQILTKPAWDTQGWLASAAVGTEDAAFASLRYGGRVSPDTFYRVYAQYRTWEPTYVRGEKATATTDFFQSGFRMDARRDGDTTLTWQGDVYTNKGLFRDGVREEVSGANMLGRWQRLLSFESDAQLSLYYDYTDRHFEVGLKEERHTIQATAKYRLTRGRNDFQIGTDNMASWDEIGNLPFLQFDPAERTVYTASLFGSHTFHFVPERFSTTAGVKVEHNSFTGVEVQPTLRAAWTPSDRTTVWAAVSRAVRTPVRFDHDVVFPGIFTATEEYDAEEVIAYELGFRNKPVTSLAVDVVLFENEYDNLRSYQPIGGPIIPLTFRNMLNARTNGVELTLLYQPFSRLFLKGTYRYFQIYFTEDPGARNLFGTRFEANDPKHLGTLTARLDLPANIEWDTTLRYVGSLPWQQTKGYLTADVHLGWSPREDWQIALVGRNLLDHYHVESIIPQEQRPGQEVARGFFARVTWKY